MPPSSDRTFRYHGEGRHRPVFVVWAPQFRIVFRNVKGFGYYLLLFHIGKGMTKYGNSLYAEQSGEQERKFRIQAEEIEGLLSGSEVNMNPNLVRFI